MTDCAPGKSDNAESSSVMYSKLSLFKPARGCNWDGSAKAELLRNESTPCASEGSKGGGVKVSVGVCVDEEGVLDVEDDEVEEDFRPVSASQIDILTRY
jgi:hypothetical protein